MNTPHAADHGAAHAIGGEERNRLMREMIHRLDVDLLELAYDRLGTTYARARDKCLSCACVAECKDWLAGSADVVARPGFCPNYVEFSRFRKA